MAQQSIVITCPACFTEYEVLDFDTQTGITVTENGGNTTRTIQVTIAALIAHNDCSAIPA